MSRKYTYKGAVYVFNNIVANYWEASTWAISEAKAVANLKYRFRKDTGMVNSVPITLTGKITVS